jgi:hypothetical protein
MGQEQAPDERADRWVRSKLLTNEQIWASAVKYRSNGDETNVGNGRE